MVANVFRRCGRSVFDAEYRSRDKVFEKIANDFLDSYFAEFCPPGECPGCCRQSPKLRQGNVSGSVYCDNCGHPFWVDHSIRIGSLIIRFSVPLAYHPQNDGLPDFTRFS